MCDPISIATATIVAGTAVNVGSAVMQSNAQNSAIKFNQQVAEQNAQDAIRRGNIEESKTRIKGSQLLADQRASAGASGALVDAGSFSDVGNETQFFTDQDALTVKYNAAVEAAGYRNQSALLGLQKHNTVLDASSSFLSSVSPLAEKYVSAKYGAKK